VTSAHRVRLLQLVVIVIGIDGDDKPQSEKQKAPLEGAFSVDTAIGSLYESLNL
jgi:hypothetical protein